MVVSTAQIPSSQPGEMEAHFAALLEPIRDMAKNWDIDIAHHLEDYLEELDKIQITFDGGMTTMNFSQAAFVIQKSACVYSKKVESLYVLVYQVLDMLSSKKKMAAAAAAGDAGGNDDDASAVLKDPEEEFLTLDDIKIHKNVEGKLGDDADMTPMIPRTPMSLIPMDEGEKGQNPLLSRTGDVLGSRKDFRLNTSNLHQCGTMLLDMSHLDQLEMSLRMRATSTPVPGHLVTRLEREMVADKRDTLKSMEHEDAHQAPAPEQDIDMHEDDGFGMDAPHDDPFGAQADAQNASNMQLRPRSRVEQVSLRPPKVVIDPWTELDDYEDGGVQEKELRKGKTCRVPPGLEDEWNKKRKRRPVVVQCRLRPINEFCVKNFHSHRTKLPNNELKAPRFAEFEHLYWEELTLRQKRLKEDKKLFRRRGSVVELAEVEEAEGPDPGMELARPAEDDDNFLDGLDGSYEMPAEGDPVMDLLQRAVPVQTEHIPVETTMDIPFANVMEHSIVSSYEDLVRQHVDGFLASAQQYAKITELSRRVAEWEDKIIPKLREEDQHAPFDIHKYGTKILHSFVTTRKPKKNRVVENNSEEETTDESDVSQADLENATGKVIPFRNIASGRPAHDVSRLFLASLQLANTYNIEINCNGVLDQGMDTMTVKLLSNKRHFEELEEYRAPSLQT